MKKHVSKKPAPNATGKSTGKGNNQPTKKTVPNLPSATGNPSGKGRGNAPTKSK